MLSSCISAYGPYRNHRDRRRRARALPLGIAPIDAALRRDGLARGTLHEIAA